MQNKFESTCQSKIKIGMFYQDNGKFYFKSDFIVKQKNVTYVCLRACILLVTD